MSLSSVIVTEKTGENKRARKGYFRFLAFADSSIPFLVRWVYSIGCDLYFRHKTPVTCKSLVNNSELHFYTVRDCVEILESMGLLTRSKGQWLPRFVEAHLAKRKDFDLEEWWKGIKYRKVEILEPHKLDNVILSAVRGVARKGKRIGGAFLVKATGASRATVFRAIGRLVEAKKLRRIEGKLEVPVIEGALSAEEGLIVQILKDCDKWYLDDLTKLAGKAPALFLAIHAKLEKRGGWSWQFFKNYLAKAIAERQRGAVRFETVSGSI